MVDTLEALLEFARNGNTEHAEPFIKEGDVAMVTSAIASNMVETLIKGWHPPELGGQFEEVKERLDSTGQDEFNLDPDLILALARRWICL